MREMSESKTKFERDYASDTVFSRPRSYARFLKLSSGPIVLLMFCAVIFSFGLVLFKIVVAEREAVQREIRSVTRVFENHKAVLLKEMERYAASNAAYLNIESNRSPAWIEERFGVDMALDFMHDVTQLIDGDGEILFTVDHSSGNTTLNQDRKIADRIQGPLSTIRTNYQKALVRSRAGEVSFAGSLADVSSVDIIEIDAIPHIAAAFAIVPDPGGIDMVDGPPNILISTFAIDTVHLNQLLANLSLDNLTFNRSVPVDMIGVPLATGSGTVLGYLTWYPVSRASAIIVSSIPVLAISLGVILAIAMVALRQNARAKYRLEQGEREARYAANHDSLTGCASRGYFHSIAAKRLERCREQGTEAWLVYVDIDNLKQANDIHGHSIGDCLIIAQVKRMQQALGANDLIGRIGGDEFLILTERWRSEAEAMAELKQLFKALRCPVECDGMRVATSASAGLARFPCHGETLTGVIRVADIALQRCKKEQKNTFRVYDERMDDGLREQREIRIELDAALRKEEFELAYQPILAAGSDKVASYEALLRWRHPSRGFLAPGQFLPVAQEAGLMPDIGAWVLERAIRDAVQWKSASVSVNVCTSQIHAPKFADRVGALLRKYGFPPERLILEITEGLMLEENSSTRETFLKLRDLNVSLAIDDFGTGYCSLSYLHKFRFDNMKIDRSFVSRIGQDQEADMLVQSLLGLARVMGMKAVGEGIETEAQKAFLVEAGCDYLQGFLLSRPQRVDDLPGHLQPELVSRFRAT
jgi:diguanylate cyclase (GGDEF)-like protein